MTEDFKNKLRVIIASGVYTDYGFNGEDYVAYELYNEEQVFVDIIELLKEEYPETVVYKG